MSATTTPAASLAVQVRDLGLRDYTAVYDEMRAFTAARTAVTADELWCVEHPPVFTQGQAGKPEHLLAPGGIPVVQSNRGGQVTYHGPGQAVIYVLVDIARRGYGIRRLVTTLENVMIEVLGGFGIAAHARPDAPGVYVGGPLDGRAGQRKIGSLGLRVSRGCSYHGLSLNVAMDLEPFTRINPCGLIDMPMTQINDLVATPVALADVQRQLVATLIRLL
ncbi:MAG: lipoyl(octanoyl) transferase LipB [Gammaproteobacteria bacterium]|nr:lipoyl(octanoyl) transferase LipB [Gammaproteobacteria bacterium]